MKPNISIIIPCYNVENYIRKCLGSIIDQSYRDFEIICINDGSKDGTLSILKEFAEKDSRIKLYDQKNKGLSKTRTTGIEYASGEYTMFVDGDDWLSTDCLKIVLDAQKDYDIICFSYTREFENQSLPKHFGFSGEYSASDIQRRIIGPVGKEVSRIENLDALVTVWGKLYKSEKIKNMIFEEVSKIGTWEDGLFNVHVLENCEKILIIDQQLYHYRKNNQTSFTSLYRKDLHKKWIFKFSLISQFIQHKDQVFKKALQNRIGISTLGLLLTEINNNNSTIQKIKGIRKILAEETYHNALENLDLSSMPVQWKIFYTFARYKFATGAFLLSRTIFFIINRKN
jgi:glycosyltransferase EpsH